jgi:hypothetical protein
LEAAVKAWDHFWGDRYGDEALEEMGDEVKVALTAADAHDRANGIHRIAIDDATVERAARALLAEMYEDPTLKVDDEDRGIIRSVLAAAVKEEQA